MESFEKVVKMAQNYYQKEIETMSREDMKKLQSESWSSR